MVCAQQSNLPSLGLEISTCRICGDADCEVVRLLVSKSYPIKYRELDKEGDGWWPARARPNPDLIYEQLAAMDVLAPTTMTNAAKCDT